MASYSQNVNTFTDYGAEAQEIERRRKMAELLQQQSIQPIEQQPGVPISWTQGLAKMLQGYNAGAGLRDATEKQKALAEKARQEAMAWAQGMPQPTIAPMAGSAEDTMQFDIPAQMETKQPSKQEMLAFALKGATSGNPIATQLAGPFMSQAMKQDEPYTLAPGAVRMGPNNQPIASAPFRPLTPPAPPKTDQPGTIRQRISGENFIEEELQTDGTWKEIGKGPRFAKSVAPSFIQEAPVTPVTIADPKDPNKTIVIDGRTMRVLGAGPKATEVGRLENTRAFGMQGLGGTIAEAERILTGGTGNLPTGSTLGNIVDTAAGVFGVSPAGAKEADQLKALGGALVSKMPRMQGPQSDKDVLLYKEMAGRVGDATIPRDRRIAALDIVKQLWAKYETAPQSTGAPTGLPSQSAIDAEIARRQGRR